MKTVTTITLTNNIKPDAEKMTREIFGSPELLNHVKKEVVELYEDIFSDADNIKVEFNLVEESE